MAANMNMQQMGMPQQQQRRTGIPSQLTAIVYQQLVTNTPVVSGWRAGVQFPERMGKTVNLITNIILANPGIDWQKAVQAGLDFERKAFLDMLDRNMYDKQMNNKISEQFAKRQSNGQTLRNDLNNQQLAQQQAIQQQQAAVQQQQQQQQQLLMATQNPMLQTQLRAFGQSQSFQHMQHAMQGTPISQPQQMVGGIAMQQNAAGMQMAPNQAPMNMNMNALRPGGVNMQPADLSKLTDADRMKVNEFAQRLYMNTDENTRRTMQASVQNRLNPQTIQNLQRQGKDPVMHLFQVQALNMLKAQSLRSQMAAGQDVNQAQSRMQLQQKAMAPGMVNPNMMNVSGPGQPAALSGAPTGPVGAAGPVGQFPFNANMETIMNEQKAGMMAQEAGQVVVPASGSQPGRNTPQPIGGAIGAPGAGPGNVAGQNRPGTQQGGPQLQQQFNMPMNMDKAVAAANAQNQQRGIGSKQLQGAGMGQSPGMGTMSVPMARQATGQGDGSAPQQQPPQTPQQQQQQLAQGAGPFAGQLDPRFNQRPPISVPPSLAPAYQSMLNNMTPEQREKLSNFSPEKRNELMARWVQGQQQNRAGKVPGGPGAAQMQAGRPGQMNQAQMNNQIAAAPGQFGNGQQVAGLPPNMTQVAMMQQRQMMRPQAAIDNMDLPTQVTSQFTLPPEVKKWREFKAWITQNNVPDAFKSQLLSIQMMQFRQIMEKKNTVQQAQLGQQRAVPPGMQPAAGASGANAGGPVNTAANMQQMAGMMPNIPPHLLQLTPVEIAQMRNSNPKLANAPEEMIKRYGARLKHENYMKHYMQQQMKNGMQAGVGMQQPQQNPAQPFLQQQQQAQSTNQQQQQQQQLQQQRLQQQVQQQLQMQLQQQQQLQMQQLMQQQGLQLDNANPMAMTQPMANALGQHKPNGGPVPTAMGQMGALPVSGPGSEQAAVSATAGPNAKKPQVNRPPINNRKRPSPDETANAGQVNAATQRPATATPTMQQQLQQQQQQLQQQRLGMLQQMSAEQFAKLTPEQQERFRSRQQMVAAFQPNPEIMNHLMAIRAEVQQDIQQESFPDIRMTPDEMDEVWKKILETADPLVKVGKQLGRFYMATRDEVRTRKFFRTRYRISQQFKNSETLTGRKPMFSITLDEIESHRNLLMDMGRDAMNHMRKAQTSQAALNHMQVNQKMSQMAQAQLPGVPSAGQAGEASTTGAVTQAIPAPLSQANLEENNRAHTKMHSKSGQTPAAPTTAQPPFPLHAISPHGQPAYIGKPSVTQDNLHLPAPKRRKTGGQGSAASPATAHTPVATTPSQIKMTSPDMRRQHSVDTPRAQPSMPMQHPTKPLLYCTEADCDMKTIGFVTEEARRVHVEEEHTRPNADPLKFAQECLAEALGLDENGKSKGANAPGVGGATTTSAMMTASTPRQGLTPATPMSRVTSMNRQASAASGVGKGAAGGKGAPGRTGNTPRVSDGQLPNTGVEGEMMLPSAIEDPWDLATVDPSDLSNAFSFAADSAANGAISDFSIYLNSITPNDTPESKADSGWSSEPPSDILDTFHADNGFDLFTGDDGTIKPSVLDNVPPFSMQLADANEADMAQMYFGDASGVVPLDIDLADMFSKSSIELDPQLYRF